MQTVNVYEAKANLSSIINRVEQFHEKIIILKHGHPVAEINPILTKSRITPDESISKISINYNPTETTEAEWEQ